MESLYNYIATFFGGGLLVHLWNKLINRISILRYSVFHQHLAISPDIPGIGSIEILHNKIPVKSLYLSTVSIINDTSRDLSNVEINLSCDSNSIIIVSQGINKSIGKNIYFTNRYSKILSDTENITTKDALSFRDYLLPVVNRGDVVEFTLLIVNDLGNYPYVTATCEHVGIKLKFQKAPRQKLFGESTSASALIGIPLTALICYFIIYFSFSLTAGVWASFVLGLFASLIGIGIIKLFKKLRRLLT